MPDVSGPFDSASFGQANWYRDRGWLERSCLPGPVPANVGSGDLAWSANGLTSSIALGRAHVRGAFYERTGTAFTYAHPANSNANPRIDTFVLRRDLAAKTVTVAVLQGTPAATPSAVALTQVENGVWEVPLFDVTVPANSGTVLAAADRRVWLDPVSGLLDTGWRTLTLNSPTTAGTTGNRYRVRGQVCTIHLDSNYNGTYGAAFQLVSNLPAEARPQQATYAAGVAYGGALWSALVEPSDGSVRIAAGFTASGVLLDVTYQTGP